MIRLIENQYNSDILRANQVSFTFQHIFTKIS